jgi:hypothetical protein
MMNYECVGHPLSINVSKRVIHHLSFIIHHFTKALK